MRAINPQDGIQSEMLYKFFIEKEIPQSIKLISSYASKSSLHQHLLQYVHFSKYLEGIKDSKTLYLEKFYPTDPFLFFECVLELLHRDDVEFGLKRLVVVCEELFPIALHVIQKNRETLQEVILISTRRNLQRNQLESTSSNSIDSSPVSQVLSVLKNTRLCSFEIRDVEICDDRIYTNLFDTLQSFSRSLTSIFLIGLKFGNLAQWNSLVHVLISSLVHVESMSISENSLVSREEFPVPVEILKMPKLHSLTIGGSDLDSLKVLLRMIGSKKKWHLLFLERFNIDQESLDLLGLIVATTGIVNLCFHSFDGNLSYTFFSKSVIESKSLKMISCPYSKSSHISIQNMLIYSKSLKVVELRDSLMEQGPLHENCMHLILAADQNIKLVECSFLLPMRLRNVKELIKKSTFTIDQKSIVSDEHIYISLSRRIDFQINLARILEQYFKVSRYLLLFPTPLELKLYLLRTILLHSQISRYFSNDDILCLERILISKSSIGLIRVMHHHQLLDTCYELEFKQHLDT